MDVGGDIGALVVHVPHELIGAELEICPHGARRNTPDDGAGWWQGEWRADHGTGHHHGPAWPHVGVLLRHSPEGPAAAAVFPSLRAGRYDVWERPNGRTTLVADVRGGEVTMARWAQPNDR